MGTCRLPALLAVSIAIGLAGCGGDNDPSAEPPTTSPPEPAETRPESPEAGQFPAEFVKQVDPICTKAQGEIDKIANTRARDEASVDKLAQIYATTAKDLEALKPPGQNATAYQQFTDSWRDGEDLFQRLSGELGRGDSSAFQRVPAILDEANTEIKDLASEYGFQGCATD
jgi:hypothetical protein